MTIGSEVIILDEVGSTNEYAKTLAENGAKSGTVVWAKRQTAGKGTHGRGFVSLDGNVFWSVIIRPADIPVFYKQYLVYINALAVYNAIAYCIGDPQELSIKWPNDMLLRQKKIAASLLEASADWVVIGTGINVSGSPSADASMVYPPSSLQENGYTVTREAVIAALNEQLNREIQRFLDEGFLSARDRYLKKAFKLNEEIAIGSLPDKSDYIKGIYTGIDDTGCLLLKRGDTIKKFGSGTVALA